MTENEKALFSAVSTLGSIVSELLCVQAETNRLLADKLPNVSSAAQAALKASAKNLEQRAKSFGVAAKNLGSATR